MRQPPEERFQRWKAYMQQKDKFCTTKAGCRKQSYCHPPPPAPRKRLNKKGPPEPQEPRLCLNTSEPAKQIRQLEAVFAEPAPGVPHLTAALKAAREAEQASEQALEADETPANKWRLELAKARKKHILDLARPYLPPRHEARLESGDISSAWSMGSLLQAFQQARTAEREAREAWNANKTPENKEAFDAALGYKNKIYSMIDTYTAEDLKRTKSLYEAHRGSGGASSSSGQAPRNTPPETPSLQEGSEEAGRADQAPEASTLPSSPRYEAPSRSPSRSPTQDAHQPVFEGDAKHAGRESEPSTAAAPATPQYDEPPEGARDDAEDSSGPSLAPSPGSPFVSLSYFSDSQWLPEPTSEEEGRPEPASSSDALRTTQRLRSPLTEVAPYVGRVPVRSSTSRHFSGRKVSEDDCKRVFCEGIEDEQRRRRCEQGPPASSLWKERYKQLAKIYHPDKSGRNDDMQYLNACKQLLMGASEKDRRDQKHLTDVAATPPRRMTAVKSAARPPRPARTTSAPLEDASQTSARSDIEEDSAVPPPLTQLDHWDFGIQEEDTFQSHTEDPTELSPQPSPQLSPEYDPFAPETEASEDEGSRDQAAEDPATPVSVSDRPRHQPSARELPPPPLASETEASGDQGSRDQAAEDHATPVSVSDRPWHQPSARELPSPPKSRLWSNWRAQRGATVLQPSPAAQETGPSLGPGGSYAASGVGSPILPSSYGLQPTIRPSLYGLQTVVRPSLASGGSYVAPYPSLSQTTQRPHMFVSWRP